MPPSSRRLLLPLLVVSLAAVLLLSLSLSVSSSSAAAASASAAAAAFGLSAGTGHLYQRHRPRASIHRRRRRPSSPASLWRGGSSSSSSAFGLTATTTRLFFAATSSSNNNSKANEPISFRTIPLSKDETSKRSVFKLAVDLPRGVAESSNNPSGGGGGGPRLQALLVAEPVLSGPSELVEIRYRVPFELSVEPIHNLALCTQDGPSPTASERRGDVLRYASQWTLGLPRQVGIAASAAAFGGALSWQSSMFDVMRAVRWEQLVQALLSNTVDRTYEVVLVFERPVLLSDGD
jgi:hypothetical protein